MSIVLHFPDIYSGDAGIDFSDSYVVIAKATQGTGYKNPQYNTFRKQAASHKVYFVAYHFLTAGNGKAQADNYCALVGAETPGMVDIEPTDNSNPSLQDAVDFITECRAKGRRIYLSYFPHWYWQQIGSPSLAPLAKLNQRLVTSNYTTYSDNGPGWNGYGGLNVAIWQYSDTVAYGGISQVDFNAFKGAGKATTYPQLMVEFDQWVNHGKWV